MSGVRYQALEEARDIVAYEFRHGPSDEAMRRAIAEIKRRMEESDEEHAESKRKGRIEGLKEALEIVERHPATGESKGAIVMNLEDRIRELEKEGEA